MNNTNDNDAIEELRKIAKSLTYEDILEGYRLLDELHAQAEAYDYDSESEWSQTSRKRHPDESYDDYNERMEDLDNMLDHWL